MRESTKLIYTCDMDIVWQKGMDIQDDVDTNFGNKDTVTDVTLFLSHHSFCPTNV